MSFKHCRKLNHVHNESDDLCFFAIMSISFKFNFKMACRQIEEKTVKFSIIRQCTKICLKIKEIE